jgi:hypothetical protein
MLPLSAEGQFRNYGLLKADTNNHSLLKCCPQHHSLLKSQCYNQGMLEGPTISEIDSRTEESHRIVE